MKPNSRRRVKCGYCPREITDYIFKQHMRFAHPSHVNMPRKPKTTATLGNKTTIVSTPIESNNYDNWIGNDKPYIIDDVQLEIEQFPTGAVRRKTETIRLDLIPLEALEGYGRRLYYGATVRGYGPRNWEKGISYSNLIQHAQTHLSKLAMQIIDGTSIGNENLPYTAEQTYPDGADSPYGNACALLWNAAAIVTFLARGNPAEKK
jgi:dATP/dGTP diphosphohydrolase